jgi:hypothetical protein
VNSRQIAVKRNSRIRIRQRHFLLHFAFLLFIASCSPPALSAEEIAAALPTVAAERTLAAIETGVAAQSGGTPASAGTPTATGLPPAVLTATAEFQLTGPHGDGVYQVGVSIAPGIWRAIPQRDGYCYWARRKYDGILLGVYYGPPVIEMRVRDTDFEIEFDGCGVFVFMGK